jgi:hypothetical protein
MYKIPVAMGFLYTVFPCRVVKIPFAADDDGGDTATPEIIGDRIPDVLVDAILSTNGWSSWL